MNRDIDFVPHIEIEFDFFTIMPEDKEPEALHIYKCAAAESDLSY